MKEINLVDAEAHIREVMSLPTMKHMQPTPAGVTMQMRQNNRVLLFNGIIQDLTEIQLPDFDRDKIEKHLPMAIRIGYGEAMAWLMDNNKMSREKTINSLLKDWRYLEVALSIHSGETAISLFTKALAKFLLGEDSWTGYYLAAIHFVEEAIPEIRCFSELMEPLPKIDTSKQYN